MGYSNDNHSDYLNINKQCIIRIPESHRNKGNMENEGIMKILSQVLILQTQIWLFSTQKSIL